MNDAAKMFLALVGASASCGLLLAGAHGLTAERIAMQELKYVKGPAVRAALAGADNDPLTDRKVVSVSGREVMLFFGKKDGTVMRVALETGAQGYGGPMGVITGFDPQSGVCRVVRIALMRETPGIGSRIASEQFTNSFEGLDLGTHAALRKDGGAIDGISGATVSSRAVCSAVAEAQKLFAAIKKEQPEVIE